MTDEVAEVAHAERMVWMRQGQAGERQRSGQVPDRGEWSSQALRGSTEELEVAESVGMVAGEQGRRRDARLALSSAVTAALIIEPPVPSSSLPPLICPEALSVCLVSVCVSAL